MDTKHLKELIIEAVQDATDTIDGTVSIPILDHFLDGVLTEYFRQFDIRQKAMEWWNGLADLRKTQLCDTNTEIVGGARRWETLSGREVQMIYEAQ